MRAVDLFAGAGGVALGFRSRGVEATHFEIAPEACATLRRAGFTDVVEGDLRETVARWARRLPPNRRKVDLTWASPPCTAFSMSGDKMGAESEVNGWPWTLDALDVLRPTWALCENVPGMEQHDDGCDRKGPVESCRGCYLERWILPEFRRRFSHVRLQRLCSADFGVAQLRYRTFIAAGPKPYQWPIGDYGPSWLARRPWVTVREALAPLWAVTPPDTLVSPGASTDLEPSWYDLVDLDRPAQTIRADGPTNIVHPPYAADDLKPDRWTDRGRRRLAPSEAAILCGFPMDYPFPSTKSLAYRQAGNAVPPPVAAAMVHELVRRIAGTP